jgi:FMN phosphatase YigB (HAD superfamily)
VITTLLFDLDDTLLGNDMETFLPAYFGLLTQHFSPEVSAEGLTAALIAGMRAMFANTDPARSLRAVFEEVFFPRLGWEPDVWLPRFDEFYRTVYPQLQGVVRPRPVARTVVEWAIAAGYEVVVATSPVFPLAALQERLRWAEIADFPYARITHYANSHFAKPNPAYLAEILACLGRRPDEALMIGNDWTNDITPAGTLGMPQFWIAPPDSVPPHSASRTHPIGIGPLEMFFEWAQAALGSLNLPPPPAGALPFLLLGNAAVVTSLLEDAPSEESWKLRPGPSEWSLTEILCHLRDVDIEVNLPRLSILLESDNPFFSAVDSDRWAQERGYQSQSGPQAWHAFMAARKEMHVRLTSLPLTAWNRPARHSLFGPTHLAEIVGWIVDHDRIHLEQLRATLQKISPSLVA